MFIRLGAVNIGGWSDSKAIRLRQIILQYNLDILMVSETRRNLDDVIPGKGRTLIVLGAGNKTSGVAVVKPQGRLITIKESGYRMMHLEFQSKVHIIGVYGPIEKSTESDKALFWKGLEDILANIRNDLPVVVIGDFNAGNEESRHSSAFGSGKPNFVRMAEFAETNRMEIQQHLPTWISSHAAAADNKSPGRTLDRCLIRYDGDMTSNIDVDFALRPSDHGVLIAKIHFLDIDRNVGRPHHKKLTTKIDEVWNECRAKLQFRVDKTPPLDIVNEFWKAKRLLELESRRSLQIMGDGEKIIPNENAIVLLRDYLYDLWGVGEGSWNDLLVTWMYDDTSVPSNKEIETAMGGLREGTALGRDRIIAANIKGCEKSVEAYKEIFTKMWELEEIPTQWKDMRVCPVPKKDTLTRVSDVRPITCLSTSSKLLNKILINRHREKYEAALHKCQHAYRSQHSTSTAVEQLIGIIKGVKTLHVASLDMSKAYDKVTKRAIKEALDRWKLPVKDRNIVVQQYIGSQVYVELNGYVAEPFTFQQGIRQGCAISCMIFALIMTSIHQRIDELYHGNEVGLISYSDDMMLYSEDLGLLETAVGVTDGILGSYGLLLNRDKTEYFRFGDGGTAGSHTKWLGFELTFDLSWTKYTDSRLIQINKAAEKIQDVLSKKRINIRQKDGICIINGMISSYVHLPGFITLDDGDMSRLENEVMRVICRFAKLGLAKAFQQAQRMIKGETKPQKSAEYIPCGHCGKLFRGKAGLSRHVVTCSLNKLSHEVKESKCPHCGEMFHSRGVHQHIKHCKKNVRI